jgi:hypothetical protein
VFADFTPKPTRNAGRGSFCGEVSAATKLESLKKYEEELRNELSTVRERLKELETDKK